MAKNRLEIIASMKDDLSKTLKKIDKALDKANQSIKDTGRSSKAAGNNVDKLSRKMQTAGTRSRSLYQGIKKLSRGLSNLKFLLGAAATAFGVFLAGRTAANVVKTAASIERLTAEIGTLLGDVSGKNLEDLNFAIRSMAVKGGQTLEDEFKAAYDAISAGIPKERLLEFLEATNKLAVAGVTDVATATDLLTTVVNSFNKDVDDVDDILDSLFTTVKFGKLRIADLAAALGRVSPIAEKVGLSLDEMNAGIATLTISGLKTEEATTALRQLLSTLIDLTPQAQKGLEELGMTDIFSLEALREKGFSKFIRDLAGATEGQTENIAKFVSNIRALTGALSLVNENGAKLSEIMDGFDQKFGAAQAAFEKTSNTFAFQFDRFKTLIEAVKVDIGNLVLPSLMKGVKAFVDNIEAGRIAFKNLTDEINRLKEAGEIEGPFGALSDLMENRSTLVGHIRFIVEESLMASLAVVGQAFIELLMLAARLFGDAIATRLSQAIVEGILQTPLVGDALDMILDLTNARRDSPGVLIQQRIEAEERMRDIQSSAGFSGGSWFDKEDLEADFNKWLASQDQEQIEQTYNKWWSEVLSDVSSKWTDIFSDLFDFKPGMGKIEHAMKLEGEPGFLGLTKMVPKFRIERTMDSLVEVFKAKGTEMQDIFDLQPLIDELKATDRAAGEALETFVNLAKAKAKFELTEEMNQLRKTIENTEGQLESSFTRLGDRTQDQFAAIVEGVGDTIETRFGEGSKLATGFQEFAKFLETLHDDTRIVQEVFTKTGEEADKSSRFITKLGEAYGFVAKKIQDVKLVASGFAAARTDALAEGQIGILNALGLSDQAKMIQLKRDLAEISKEISKTNELMKEATKETKGQLMAEIERLTLLAKAKDIEMFRLELQQEITKAKKDFNESVKLLNIEQQGGLKNEAQFAKEMTELQKQFNKTVQESVNKMDELKKTYPELIPLIDLSKQKMLEVLESIKGAKAELSQTNQFVNAFATSLTTATSLATEAGSIIGNNLGSAIDSVITGAKSIGEAFRDMAIGIVQDLAKVIVKMLIIQALSAIFPGAGIAAPSFFGIGANKGGLIPGFSRGGKVGGSGPDRDSVHAMLTPGEFVIRRSAVQALGLDLLTKLNNVRLPGSIGNVQTGGMQGYNQGGQVSQQTASPTPAYVVANERSMQSLLSGGRAAMIDFLRSNRDSFMGDSRHMM